MGEKTRRKNLRLVVQCGGNCLKRKRRGEGEAGEAETEDWCGTRGLGRKQEAWELGPPGKGACNWEPVWGKEDLGLQG